MDAYELLGFETRVEYLLHLSEQYGVDFKAVLSLAESLGESEDFDGLHNALEELSR